VTGFLRLFVLFGEAEFRFSLGDRAAVSASETHHALLKLIKSASQLM
jgi:hypothetical protein